MNAELKEQKEYLAKLRQIQKEKYKEYKKGVWEEWYYNCGGKEYGRKYREEHKEELREYHRAYYQAHKKEIAKKKREDYKRKKRKEKWQALVNTAVTTEKKPDQTGQ